MAVSHSHQILSTMRVLVALLTVAHLQVATAAATPPRKVSPVLIVGAGVAGANVALELSKHDIPFIIFEATDVVGGRMRQAPLGKEGLQVELGANWMQGFRKGVPFFDFVVSEVKLKRTPTDFDDIFFVDNGKIVPDEVADPVWGAAGRSFNKLYAVAKQLRQGKKNVDVMDIQAAAEFAAGFSPTRPIEIAAWRTLIDFEYAVPGDMVSVAGLSPIFAPDAPKSVEMFILDQRGFKAAVDLLLNKAGVNDTTRSGSNLRLSSPVRRIQYSKGGARITLRNGKKYEGSAVVSTVSLGVLKHSLLKFPEDPNRLTFDPPLKQGKRKAISKLVIGDYLKIFVQFKAAVLTKKDPLFLVPLSCDEEGFINIQNLNKREYFPGANTVLVTSTDAYSRQLTCEDDEKVLQDVLRYVSKAVGRKLGRSEVQAYVIPKFRRDEFFRGSFSVRTPSVTDEDIEEFNKPVGGLFFAGEAHGLGGLSGYVHGAWDTGIVTAKQVRKFLRRK